MMWCILGNFWILFVLSLIVIFMFVNFIIDHSISTEKRKTVLITGCDSGFGFITALELSASNCKVYAGCLTQNGVDKLQEHKKFQGKAFIMDVTKEEDIENAKVIIKNEGGLDGIVNNAGITTHGPFQWQSVEAMKNLFEVNYWGTVKVIKAMIPLLKQSQGRIINLSSMGGRIGVPYLAPYCSSKFAIEGLSDSLRIELKPWCISVHLIEPTLYKTEITNEQKSRDAWQKIWNEQPQSTKEEVPLANVITLLDEYHKIMKLSENTHEVSLKIKHALLAGWPRRRYITGKESSIFVLATHFPTIVLEYILTFRIPSISPIDSKKLK